MSKDIILIGPIGAGKSTQGERLSKRLRLPQVQVDRVKWPYYEEIGFDQEFDDMLGNQAGFWARYLYWKEFECHAVERILAEHEHCVIDFGGGHSVYENNNHFARIRSALEPYRNVVLLIPSDDVEESLQILADRKDRRTEPNTYNINEHFLRHHSNYDLAKHIVCTKNRTPEQTTDDLLDVLDL